MAAFVVLVVLPIAAGLTGMALVFFAGSGWALREGAHIKVILVTRSLLARAGALFVTGYASYALIRYALCRAELGSMGTYLSQSPLALPEGLLAAAFVLLGLALFARLARLLTGELPEKPHQGVAP